MNNPKSYLIILISFLSIIIFSCDQSTEPNNTALVRIDLGIDFQNDSVKVDLDNQTLVIARVTTDYTVSAAWMSQRLNVSRGNHTIKLTVISDTVATQTQLYLQDTITVVADYTRQSRQIEFHTFKFLLMRD